MLNLLHAQLYRLIRSVTFWGFLGLTAFIAYVVGRSVAENALMGSQIAGLPPLNILGDWQGVVVDAELVLSAYHAPLYLCLFTSLVVAVLYSDDGHQGGLRSLMVGKGARQDYVLAMTTLSAVVALSMVLVAFVATWAAFLPFALMSVGFSGGRFVRWAMMVVLAAVFCSMVTLTVLLATGRKTVAVLFAVLLCCSVFESALGAIAFWLGAEGVMDGVISWLPLQVVERVGISGMPPLALDMLSPAVGAAAAMALCWLAIRRKRI
ncbi:hypothetical protein [uncultured Adlercreutzia sp.]|uniref:hypothetical protein n=1 Tax=uncultured Adlercreutzia sp. TaxID=875803 RepID=UPI0025D3F8F8|nr:hypothetical protein [uncultured Adlercreutzia sp.]